MGSGFQGSGFKALVGFRVEGLGGLAVFRVEFGKEGGSLLHNGLTYRKSPPCITRCTISSQPSASASVRWVFSFSDSSISFAA